MADPATLAHVWRVAPFAAVAVLGLGVLVVPEPDRSAADPSPADISAVAPAGPTAAAPEIAIPAPDPVASSPVPLPPPVVAAPAVTTTTVVPRTTTAAPTDVDVDEPLRMSSFGWSTATGAGTPAGTAGIPDESLPVGAGPSGPDKVSWFRLSGRGTSLVLQPVPDSAAHRFEGDTTLRLCRSTVADWATGGNLDAAETPPVDEARCADGVPADDGTWSFDLAALGEVDDPRGVVLVPGDGLFQITFARLGET